VFGTPMTLAGSAFSTTLDVSMLAPGTYRVWAEASLGDLSGTLSIPVNLNAPPVGSFTATPAVGFAPLTVRFDASGSSDGDLCDGVATYTFDFGDGTPPVSQSQPTISHIYHALGQYEATLQVKDERGMLSTNIAKVTVQVIAGPRITSITRLSNGRIILQCLGVPNQPYVVQASPDLVTPFAPIGNVTANSSGAFPFEDPNADAFEKRFYRLALP